MNNGFIPEIWATAIQKSLYKMSVYRNFFGLDCAQEATVFGQTVDIIETTDQIMVDHAKAINFVVTGNLLRAQHIELSNSTLADSVAYDIHYAVDNYCSNILSRVSHKLYIPDKIEHLIACDCMEAMADYLDEAGAPKEDRHVVVPRWYMRYLLDDDRFNYYGINALDATLNCNGKVGQVAGMTVHISNFPPFNEHDGNDRIIAGTSNIGAFAENTVELSTRQNCNDSNRHSITGLHIFGSKVLNPKWVVSFDAKR